MTGRKFDQDEFFQELCDSLVCRFPDIRYYVTFLNRPGNPEPGKSVKEKPSNSVDLARALTTEIPPLRRVLTFWMWMSRDFVRNVTGITDAELEEMKEKVTSERIWPAIAFTIEQWNTHTVFFPGLGRQKTIYEPLPWYDLGSSYVVWHHTFGAIVDGPSKGGSLEVVLHQNTIKCWARHGRFKGRSWNDESEDEYLFITIPLDENKLHDFLIPDDDDSVDPECRRKKEPWDKRYCYEDANRGKGWELRILDNIARAIDWS